VLEQAGKVGTPFWLSGKEGAHHRRGSTVTACRRRGGGGGAGEVLGDHRAIEAEVRDVTEAPGSDRRRSATRRPRWWMMHRKWMNGGWQHRSGCRALGWSGEAHGCGSWTRGIPNWSVALGHPRHRKGKVHGLRLQAFLRADLLLEDGTLREAPRHGAEASASSRC
jgi:hypothetical protein